MKRTFLTLLIMSFATVQLSAQDFMSNVYGRKATSLGGQWQTLTDLFSKGNGAKIYLNLTPQDKTTFYEYKFTDASRLYVPGDWNSQRPELYYYESTMWYKKDFTYDLKAGNRLFIYFGAVNYTCNVYLNGEKLGSHTGGFNPFQFEITKGLKQGNNFLIVEVNNRRSPQDIPSMIYDWWNYGGITRDVMLVETPSAYINDYFVRLEKGSQDKIKVDVELSGASAGQQINFEIPEAGLKSTLTADANGKASGVVTAKKLSLWSPENPKLYNVRLISGNDTVNEEIGFRTIETKGTKILLNGKEIFLRGVNSHDENPMRRGRSNNAADAKMIIDDVVALGCNMMRPSHYTPDEHIVREAERRGIMLFNEIPQWGNQIDFTSDATNALARTMMTELIRRDKNRCAIICWSVANETKLGPERDKALRGLMDLTRSLDDSRLVTAVMDKVKYDESGTTIVSVDNLVKDVDIVCINRYLGWYLNWPADPEKIKWNIDSSKPLVISEFGAEAMYGNHGPADVKSSWSEEYQETVYNKHIKMFDAMDNLAGTIPWVLYDFRSPYRMNLQYQEEWNRKGLLSENGFRKKAWYVISDYYARKKAEAEAPAKGKAKK